MSVQMQDQHQVPLSSMLIQEKGKSLFEDLKKKQDEQGASFTLSHGWLNRFKARAKHHNVELSGKAGGADATAAQELPETLKEITDGSICLPQQVFNVDKTVKQENEWDPGQDTRHGVQEQRAFYCQYLQGGLVSPQEP